MTNNDKVFFGKVKDPTSDFHSCDGCYDYNVGFVPFRPGYWIDNAGNLQGYSMFEMLERNGVFSKEVSDAVFDVVVEVDDLLFHLIDSK